MNINSDMPPFCGTHKGCTQIKYSVCKWPVLRSTSFSMHCATQGVYRNGASVYICMCGVVDYCASENVTLGQLISIPFDYWTYSLIAKDSINIKCWLGFNKDKISKIKLCHQVQHHSNPNYMNKRPHHMTFACTDEVLHYLTTRNQKQV